ncbi:Uncharacterised protein [Burkholderia pseudomallei]|uniref:hypothetical protein n=1 Tax=Burkholderia pseudomallei TaxID=28450 RepID=UPI0019FF0AE1|nr:hypothetical protein [Burkholderia pseudomallei]MBF3779563.1 hypothetical protein [Burkholderia pseudomallei]MDY7815373.1 hypothetical protein [Burkholderia pseudomallei]MDY7862066.1 hypothetical protein [Burkholderia pseudomallei]CAJ8938790.1 Uncharacterised protein [Burkholderia pseudomallei]CAK0596589.1 Uncharacterised protein [Burkholderia pseudomallei]
MPILSKDNKGAILGAAHLKTESVDVPEWGEGVSVIVSEMSGLARDAFYAKKEAKKDMPISESQAALLVATVVDESGAPVLDEADIESLRAQSTTALDRIVAVAVRINGLQANAADDAAKNSAAAPSGDSGSA